MTPGEGRYDVVVVGAGPAGAAAALHMHKAGLRVALLEREPFDGTGHDWYVGVPRRMLDESGLDLVQIQRAKPVGSFVVQGPSGRGGIEPRGNPVCELHLGDLVAALRGRLLDEGVDCFGKVVVDGFAFQGERPEVLYAHRSDKGRSVMAFRASLFVDASGLSAALRRRVPHLAARCAVVGPRDLCSAFQEVREVSDPGAAGRFLASRGVRAGQHLAWTGVAGGYSTLTIRVSPDMSRVWLLAGAALDMQGTPGRQLLRRFRQEQSWVGSRVSGAGGLIPIRRPYGTLVSEGMALIGNAACQVFPTHASGVGASLVAARYLAEAVASHRDRDVGRIEVLWGYQNRYQKNLGMTQAVHDVFRSFFQRLDRDEQDRLVEAGFPPAGSVLAALDQRIARPGLDSVSALTRLAIEELGMLSRLAALVGRSAALAGLYRLHPAKYSSVAVERWSRLAARIVGEGGGL